MNNGNCKVNWGNIVHNVANHMAGSWGVYIILYLEAIFMEDKKFFETALQKNIKF